MRPTVIQRLIADDWPFYFLALAIVVFLDSYTITAIVGTSGFTLVGLAWLVLLIPIASALGLMLSVFPGMLLLGPFYVIVGKLNGAPFEIGDQVLILCRRHRGERAEVYEIWPQRMQVRLRLGEAEKRNFDDVFRHTEVCRTPRIIPQSG